MKRKYAVLAALLAAVAAVMVGSAGANRIATPCMASSGSPYVKSLKVCVGGLVFFPGNPGGTARVTVFLSSMTGSSLARVQLKATLPKSIKMLKSQRRYKLVKGTPTWVVASVPFNPPSYFNFSVRTAKKGKPGSTWCIRLVANASGNPLTAKSQPICANYSPVQE